MRKLFTQTMLMATLTVGCTTPEHQASDKKPVPLDMRYAGQKATVHLSVYGLGQSYPQSVVLMINPPTPNWKDKDGNSLVEKYDALIESLTGLKFLNYEGSIKPKPHTGISLNITWLDSAGKIITQGPIHADHGRSRVTQGHGTGFVLDSMTLPPGHYSVIVETIKNDPRFESQFITEIIYGFNTH